MKIPAKIRILLRPILVLVAIVLSGFVVIRPIFFSITKVPTNVKTLEAKLADLQENVAVLDALDETELREQLSALQLAAPAQKNVVGGISAIKVAAFESGTLLSSLETNPGRFTLNATESAQIYSDLGNSFAYEISIMGTYEQIKEFIAKIESKAPLLQVNQMNFSRGADELTEARFRISSYFIEDDIDLGEADEPIAPLSRESMNMLDRAQSLVTVLLPPQEGSGVGRENPFTN
jgi:Tfp pilus assembly protein PilO